VSNVSDLERKDDEVLVSVRAAGLNFVDLLYVRTPSLLRHVKAWTANESFIFVLLQKLKVACIIVSFTV
jgi:NADPH:quinone reductase-like Zn-dependent oxidoreductase